MLFRRPCYYDNFTCIADKCSDSCCIGWEICIDPDTAEKYRSASGDFGERLRRSISFDGEPSFILKGERCPFLNKNNLCDIISELGENALCQICRDHPRWFEWYGDLKEGGIGLSCEEGARLILGCEGFADYFESEIDEEADEDLDKETLDLLFSLREECFDLLGDTSLSLTERFAECLCLAERTQQLLTGEPVDAVPSPLSLEKELEGALRVLEKTEPIDESWSLELKRLIASPPKELSPDATEEQYLTRLFAYFLWRYLLTAVFDLRVKEKVSLAVFSVTVIFALYKNQPHEKNAAMLKSAVLYSKQMEYSRENLDLFFSSLK